MNKWSIFVHRTIDGQDYTTEESREAAATELDLGEDFRDEGGGVAEDLRSAGGGVMVVGGVKWKSFG
ncbi:hypothetical protein SO802_002596 [Lithocarpus litseifolius]|uniref:Uncharacterized protein n=1 Tax=Lithocarpus litseifolius TaxID=425828 RepID=A0AAW2E0A4_9ROSI